MREFSASISEPLTQGLRPEPEVVGHSAFLRECFNMKPAEGGLEAYISPDDPFEGGVSTSWPWPQVFMFDDYTLLAEEDAVHVVDKTTTPWSTTTIDTLDPSNPTTSKSIPTGGGSWHGADLGESWYLFKGNATVFQTGLHRIDSSPRRFVGTGVPINTATTHKGRIVMGGFEEGNFWTQDFIDIFNTFTQPTGVNFNFDDVGPNWLAWSSIGGGDFPFWHFEPSDLDTDLDIHLTKERFLLRLKRNELGFMPLPFEGEVLNITPLGDGLVVYGEDGIAFVSLVTGGEVAASTYGVDEVLGIGIADRSAVASGGGAHVFVSADGNLWRLDQGDGLTRLGYKEYIDPLLGEEILCHYNPSEEEFYICNSNEGFVLTAQGLASHKDHLTEVVQHVGTTHGLSHDPDGDRLKVVTNDTDLSLSAQKRVNNVHVEYSGIKDLRGAVHVKYDRDGWYVKGEFTDLNKEGVLHERVSGVVFRTELNGLPETTARINRISMRYQVSDKRAIRGTFRDVT